MMLHLGSPIGTFVADRCVLGPEYSIEKADLYRAYKEWCASTGREKSAVDDSTFGRDLRAVDPKIATTRPRRLGPDSTTTRGSTWRPTIPATMRPTRPRSDPPRSGWSGWSGDPDRHCSANLLWGAETWIWRSGL